IYLALEFKPVMTSISAFWGKNPVEKGS
uniref:Uncharacterized protein n=1 Tax=Amphimedon queenslandica TaxID=400682 RepID=A0A1X7TGE1_AMPQE